MRLAIKRASWALAICAALLMSVLDSDAAASAAEYGQCVAVLNAGTAASSARSPQVWHDARANATFYFTLAKDGGIRLSVQAGELEAEKTVYPDGRFNLQVGAGPDRVAIRLAPGELNVERRHRTVQINPQQATDEDWLQVRVLLAGSKALRLFRIVASSLGSDLVDGPVGDGVLLADAVVGLVDGDVSAVARLAARKRAAVVARIRTVSLLPGQDDPEYLRCYRKYEWAVYVAQNEFNSCASRYYPWDPRQYGCSLAWTLQVESAWFQFLACSAYPMKADG